MGDADPAKLVVEQITAATHELMSTEDWATNLSISQAINSHPHILDPAMKALKKRLEHKNAMVGLHAITLTDHLIKESTVFLRAAATDDFLTFFVKTLPKQIRDPTSKSLFRSSIPTTDMRARERIDRTLIVIQLWAKGLDATRYPAFQNHYQALLHKGVIFPEPQKDEVAPMTTPPPKIPKDVPPSKKPAPSSTGGAPTSKFRDADCMAAVSVAELLVSIISADGSNLLDEMPIALLANIRNAHQVCTKRIHNYANAPGSFPESVFEEVLQTNEILLATIQFYEGVVKGTVPRDRPPAVLVPPPAAAAAPAKAAVDENKARGKAAPAATTVTRQPSSATLTPQRGVPTLAPPPHTGTSPAVVSTPPRGPVAAPATTTGSPGFGLEDLFISSPGPARPAAATAPAPAASGGTWDPFGSSVAAPAAATTAHVAAPAAAATTGGEDDDDDDPFTALARRKAGAPASARGVATPPTSATVAARQTPPTSGSNNFAHLYAATPPVGATPTPFTAATGGGGMYGTATPVNPFASPFPNTAGGYGAPTMMYQPGMPAYVSPFPPAAAQMAPTSQSPFPPTAGGWAPQHGQPF